MSSSRKRNLILLPGLDGTGLLFANLINQLEEDFEVTSISYPSKSQCSLDDLAEIVKNQMPDPRNSVLLAESFSGLVALTLLEKLPVSPKGIIFGMCFVEPPFQALLRVTSKFPITQIPWGCIPDAIYRRFCLGNLANKEQLENLKNVLSQVDPAAIFQRLRLIETFRIPKNSKNLEIPCLYIQATKDRLITNKSSIWFSQNFENFFLIEIPGPHFLFQSHVEQCAKSILNFNQCLEARENVS